MGRPPKPPHRIKHGTPGGYKWHYDHDVPMCDTCKVWKRKEQRRMRAKKKRQRSTLNNILTGAMGNGSLMKKDLDVVLKALRIVATKEELKELGLD